MFEDRFDAAAQLALPLKEYNNSPNAVIIALPRGGLQLGSVLARALHLPLDIILTKKIGYPGNPEYAIGAVSLEHSIISPDFSYVPELQSYIKQQIKDIRQLLHDRNVLYRGNKPPLKLTNKIVIVVDDGAATGNTLMATLALIKQDGPEKVVVALPVASAQALKRLREEADEVICLHTPSLFFSVGQFYKHFDQVDDQEAIRLFHESNT